jgi:virginiamycin B lyase
VDLCVQEKGILAPRLISEIPLQHREMDMKTLTLGILGLLLVGVLMALASPKHRPPAQPGDVAELKVKIREWSVPTKGAHPHDPAVGPDGALWFTEQMANKLGRLDPKTGNFREYPLVYGKNSGPHGLVADANGNIWYTANFGGYIGKLDPRTGDVTEFRMPSEKVDDPHTAVFDAQGTLWFTAQGGNAVGRLDPNTGKIVLKEVPTESALPYGIQVNSKGLPVFCELGSNKIGSVNPKSLEITEYTLPESARPRRLAIAADDTVYFTDFKSGHLGRLNMSTGEVKMYASPGGPESNPYGITITPNGMVWYSESGVNPNTIVRFDPRTETFARANIPSGGGVVRNMAATADGRVYIACSGVDKVGIVETASKR